MTRVAAIDCGTNSIRLLIADSVDGKLVDVRREMRIVRLGQGVDATGSFSPAAIDRTKVALTEYAGMIAESKATSLRMVATSATRDAANREEFFDMTRTVLGAVIPGSVAEVITGDEEARLSFAGAVGELDPKRGPFIVVDLGGGSTELVLGDEKGVKATYSANIGCVRVTERHLHSDPPTAEEISAARAFIRERFEPAFDEVPVERASTWVGVAGTMTTIAAIAQDMPEYDADRVHLSRISFTDLFEVCDRLLHMTHVQRSALGPMHPGRVDVIGAGSLICSVLAEEFESRNGISELVVSEHDILDGIAMSIV